MNVLVGSAFIVFGQQAYDLTTNETVVDGLLVETPVFANGAATVSNPGGTLGGLVDSRDTLLRNIQQEMDVLAHSMITQFNRVQSTGQGLERFDFLTSTGSMSDASLPVAIAGTVTSASTRTSINDTSLIGATNITGREVLVLSGENVLEKRVITDFDSVNGTIFFDGELPADMTIRDQFQIGELDFQVTNGSFNFVVTNELSGSQQSFNIEVDLDGIGTDTSLNDIVTAINNALPGSTSIQPDGRLRIDSPTQDVRFHFSNDTSGFVAAMGLNTFFNGSDAESIEVNNALFTNPNLLSQGQSASEGDNTNVLAFATLRAEGVVSGQSFEDFYHAMAGDLGSQSREMQNRTENQALIAQQMDNQRQRVSGVNVDEEAVKMLEYQRAYQASARFISVVDKVLESLFNGI
jgi:flagellar hook-associated protein FlgK